MQKLEDRTARVGVIGIGYVGLPTMIAAAEGGFTVTGIDISEDRVTSVNAGISYIGDVSDATLAALVGSDKILATTDFRVIHDQDVVLVCVPTPITKNKEPDLKPLESAVSGLAEHMGENQLVVLQSTTFPGTTQEIVLPKLEQNGLQAGKDFYLAFALERIDPGNSTHMMCDVPKVVGGVTPECSRIATYFFSAFVDQVIPVSSPKVAEMTKLLENTFRSVNIALVNELAMLCRRMDVDIWEVIDAASTKPFGYMPFYPGPGVGGNCIPVDPFYLSWKAKEHDFYVNFIELAANINSNMPHYMVSRIMEILGGQGIVLNGAKLLIVGVAFKENISDTRNSPAIRVMELLAAQGARVAYADPNVPEIDLDGRHIAGVGLEPELIRDFDAVVILVPHDGIALGSIVDNAKIVIDTRNATKQLGPRPNLVRV